MPDRTLSIRITSRDDASKVIKEVKTEVQGLAATTVQSNQQMATSAAAVERTFVAIQRDIQAAAKDFKAGAISTRDYGAALEFARQEALQLRAVGIKPVGVELQAFNGIMSTSAGATRKAVEGVGTLRSGLASLASQAAGVPGPIGAISSVLLSMGIGSLTTAGVFAGIAGVTVLIRKMGEAAREERKSVADFLELDPLGRQKQITEFGGLAATRAALAKAQAERPALATQAAAEASRAASLAAFGEAEVRPGGNAVQKLAELDKNIADMQAAIGDFTLNLRNEQTEEVKRILGERRQATNEADRLAKETREKFEDEREERRAARAEAREYFAAQMKLREEEISIRLQANEQLRRTLFGDAFQGVLPGHEGVATATAVRGVFGGPEPSGLRLGMARVGTGGGTLTRARKDLGRSLDEIRTEGMADIRAAAARSAEHIEDAFLRVSKTVDRSGARMVSAMSLAANALAGLITGRQSALGALGGAASGLSSVFAGAAAGSSLLALATPLGLAGIAFGFLDALTSDRNKEAQTEAHLEALRRHDQERPPATIILQIPSSDPRSRETQRLVDQTRREAEASGYHVTVQGG